MYVFPLAGNPTMAMRCGVDELEPGSPGVLFPEATAKCSPYLLTGEEPLSKRLTSLLDLISKYDD